jgi:signal peptidase
VIRHTTDRGVHTRVRRYLSFFGNLGLWAVIAFCAWFLWPSSLGGGTTFILVSGHSMEPDYSPGDLLVARSGEPSVGDVVVYRPGAEYGNAKVVHQIVGGDGSTGWDVKGINNSWHDPWTPTNADVVGVVHLHIPGMGAVSGVLLSPILWASILLVALGLLLWPTANPDDDGDEDSEPSSDARVLVGEVAR